MARRAALYEVVNQQSGEMLSRHKTRQAAVDSWRLHAAGVPVQIWRRPVSSPDVLVVEGIWHESSRHD